MSENQTAKPKKKKGRFFKTLKKVIGRIILLILIAIAALFGLRAYIRSQASGSEEKEASSLFSVRTGAVVATVYGSGTTSARSQPNVLAETSGTLTNLRVSVGDAVKAGDVLAVITNDELDSNITDKEFALWELDDTIASTKAGSRVTNILAPVAGRIMAIYAEAGDDALAVFRREGALAIISTDGRMKVELSEIPASSGVKLGDMVQVKGIYCDQVGTITDLTRQGTCATITVMTDEERMNEEVTVSTMDGVKLGEGILEINKPMAVSSYGGTISKVCWKVGDTVKREQEMFKLADSPLTLTVENLRLQREAAAKELAEAKEQRENLIILAPCDGVVASLEVKEGDSIEVGTLIGSILEGEDMNLTIAVDELDVVNVAIGQPVSITIDALPDVTLSGEVYKIAPVGSSSGGVTTYDVELTFESEGTGVRSGMNATGEIEIGRNDNAVYVPVEALMTIGNNKYVMVADGGAAVAAMAMGQTNGNAGSENGSRGSSERGSRPSFGEDGQNGSRPSFGGNSQNRQAPAGVQTAQASADDGNVDIFTRVRRKGEALWQQLVLWLYDGKDPNAAKTESVSGSMVAVTTGLQNDDYVEIVSGVNPGDVVLYTSDSADASSTMWRGMGNMGGGMRMGF